MEINVAKKTLNEDDLKAKLAEAEGYVNQLNQEATNLTNQIQQANQVRNEKMAELQQAVGACNAIYDLLELIKTTKDVE